MALNQIIKPKTVRRSYSSYEALMRKQIINNTEICRDHLTPEILLRLITPNCSLYNEPLLEESHKLFKNDPFWGFYWPGGQALSRYILDNPSVVRSKKVLDFGSGSGACSIAAMLSGARKAISNDIDDVAGIAASINATLNKTNIVTSQENLIGQIVDFDVILIGDVFYDDEIANEVLPWLNLLHKTGMTILIGDPGRHPLTNDRLKLMEKLKTYKLSSRYCLENHGFKNVNVWKWKI